MNVAARMSAAIGRPGARLAPSGAGDGLTPIVVAVGAMLLLAGSMAFLIDPKFGAAALALPALPLLALNPAYALFAFVGFMPFDTVAALLPDKTLTLTKLLGFAVIGNWAIWVLVNRVRVRLTLSGWRAA